MPKLELVVGRVERKRRRGERPNPTFDCWTCLSHTLHSQSRATSSTSTDMSSDAAMLESLDQSQVQSRDQSLVLCDERVLETPPSTGPPHSFNLLILHSAPTLLILRLLSATTSLLLYCLSSLSPLFSVLMASSKSLPPFSSVVVDRYGELDAVVQFTDSATLPQPSASQVTVRVLSAAVNPIDWKVITGLFQKYFPIPFPYVPGFDLAGVVVQVGSAVTRLKVGDEVYADSSITAGAFSQYANVEAEELAIKPKSISFAEAAALPLAAESSLTALEKGGIKRGDRVLVTGGAGGTGAYAIQIAKALGASEVIAVVSSRHVDYVKSIGADVVIDYTSSSITKSGVRDVDVVYDTVGGYWEDAKTALAPTGKFVTITFWETAPSSPQYVSHILKPSYTHLDRISQWVESGLIKTHIEKEFPFTRDGVRQMLEHSKAGKTRGKVVLKVAAAQ